MKRHVLTLTACLFAAGLVGSAFAAVPDPSPFSWSPPLTATAQEVDLPDAPPPPGRKVTPPAAPRADIVLLAEPRMAAPCPDKVKRVPRARQA